MSLFYYRPWAGVGAENGRPGYLGNFLSPADPLYYTRWGYSTRRHATGGHGPGGGQQGARRSNGHAATQPAGTGQEGKGKRTAKGKGQTR